jgi:hypothetical protein
MAHEIPDRPAVQLSIGDAVHVGDRDTEWREFVFVTAPGGTGWMPARHLSQQAGRAVVRRGYDTANCRPGSAKVLEVIAEDSTSGWVWCRSSSDRQGWVPIRTVEDG